ncbi:L,D-transpeptidase family protein [Polaromonas sp. YR568]|uniref:L,D-transpeptidase family protein n=1 Tax=Polaromonas sp. YR568 TaxID=1855301 RepID=UPI00398BC21C
MSFNSTSSPAHLPRRTLVLALCFTGLGLAGHGAWAAKPRAKAAASQPLDMEAFNNATDSPLLRSGSNGAAVARAQIMLDRAWFSCGEIDGRFAANMQRMVKAYQTANDLKVTGTVTAETWASLRKDGAPLLTTYTVTDKDAAGPFEKTPVAMDERAKMKALVYESLDEALAEKFHTSPGYLKQLNAGAGIEAGKQITVPNVAASATPTSAASIEIDKSERVLYVLDTAQRLVAGFPISIGNEKNDPLPLGMMAIKNEVKNPGFTYNPALLKTAPKNAQKVDVAAGPNNPVGSIWLGLSKPHWGIHGTPNPSNVGHSETNGCIHMTNWDAERLATLAKAGFKVNVKA